MNENKRENNVSIQPLQNKQPFLICFIIGCVIGSLAVIGNVISSAVIIYVYATNVASTYGGINYAIIIELVFSLYLGAVSVGASITAIIITSLGIKWNKIASSIVLSVIAAAMLFFIVTCSCLIL